MAKIHTRYCEVEDRASLDLLQFFVCFSFTYSAHSAVSKHFVGASRMSATPCDARQHLSNPTTGSIGKIFFPWNYELIAMLLVFKKSPMTDALLFILIT